MPKKIAAVLGIAIVVTASWMILKPPDTGDGVASPDPELSTPGVGRPAADEVGATGPEGTGAIPSVPFKEVEKAEEVKEGDSATPRASLVGRVVDPSGDPVKGASVKLTLHDRSHPDMLGGFSGVKIGAREDARTDAEGRFRIDDLPVGGEGRVRARPRNLCDVRRSVELKQTGVTDLGDLVARPGGTVAGLVRDEDGQPVADAKVIAWPISHSTEPGMFAFGGGEGRTGRRSTKTGNDGRFVLQGLEDGAITLTAEAAAYMRTAHRNVPIRSGQKKEDLVLELARGAVLEGIAQSPAGAPLEGVKVSINIANVDLNDSALMDNQSTSMKTGADGRFVFKGLEARPYNLHARLDGCLDAGAEALTPGSKPAIVTLEKAGMIWGHVVAPAGGEMIGDFNIRLFNSSGLYFLGSARSRVLRGAQAAAAASVPVAPNLYAITGMPRGQVRVLVDAKGFARTVCGPVSVPPGDALEVPVSLLPEMVIAGRVLTPAGAPAVGAEVTVGTRPRSEDSMGGERRVIRMDAPGEADEEMLIDTDQARTVNCDAEGRYSAGGLAAGEYVVVARDTANAGSEQAIVMLTQDAPRGSCDLFLRPGGRLEGRTFDADGQQLAGARVTAKPRGIKGARSRSALSDKDGRFEITGMLPGTWRASLKKGGQESGLTVFVALTGERDTQAGTDVEIRAGATTRLDLSQTPTANLVGEVREAGVPVPGAVVSLSVEGQDIPFGGPRTQTNADGLYVFDGLAPGRYDLSVRPDGAMRPVVRTIELEPRRRSVEDVELPTGIISGRVIDAANGKPVAGIRLSIEFDDGKEDSEPQQVRGVMIMTATTDGAGGTTSYTLGGAQPVLTDSDGRYTLRYLQAGAYEVSVKGGGYIPARKEAVKVFEGQATSRVDFQIAKGVTLSATADVRGDPPQFIIGRLREAGEKTNLQTEFAQQGQPAIFKGLKPGTYTVVLETPMQDWKGERDITLEPGKDATIAVPLKRKL